MGIVGTFGPDGRVKFKQRGSSTVIIIIIIVIRRTYFRFREHPVYTSINTPILYSTAIYILCTILPAAAYNICFMCIHYKYILNGLASS